MCGIAGSLGSASEQNIHQDMIQSLDAMQHRGPNDRGYECINVKGSFLCLGQTRLSIIDLSDAGHQPMHSGDGRYTLVFNGEIYNYRELRDVLREQGYQFITDTDTEVLLSAWMAWGMRALPKFIGMFAFALFDHKTQILHCARDAFGIKPFFYQTSTEAFSFASEIPALLPLMSGQPAINLQRAYDYLVLGRYDDKFSSFFEGTQHLPPGHHMQVSRENGNVEITCERWWHPQIVQDDSLTFSQAAEKLQGLFLDAVKLHMRSDVRIAASLSGGLDSSALVCAMRYIEPDLPLHTFSFIARGSSEDEEEWVDLINEHVGAIPHKVLIDPKELKDDLDDLVRMHAEPFGSTSIYAGYRVFQAAHDAGITVMLDGQGADEIFAGYHGYPAARFRTLIEQGRFFELSRFMKAWSAWPGRSAKLALLHLGDAVIPAGLQGSLRQLIGKTPQPDWLDIEYLRKQNVKIGSYNRVTRSAQGRGRRLPEFQRALLTGTGMASLLRHGDRNSMRWSIESRVPFLTPQLAEFAFSLPEKFLVSKQGETKHILRAALRGIVPDAVLDRRDKVGYATPERDWLRESEIDLLQLEKSLHALPFLKAKQAVSVVEKTISGDLRFSWQAWRIINFAKWASQYHSVS